MIIYPSIHISGGQCVIPAGYDSLNRSPVLAKRPSNLAKLWEKSGASYIHVVDLDGTTMGTPMNDESVEEILSEVSIPIQVGGGVRSIKDIDNYLNLGASRVIIGTMAVLNPQFVKEAVNVFGADKIIVGIDAKDGMVTFEGRGKISNYNAVTMANHMKNFGVRTIIYTDVSRAGMLNGPSIENTKELQSKAGNIQIIMSGGITKLSDLEAVSTTGVHGVIIGSSLYEGKMDLSEAISIYERGI